jgi:proteasome assembly chaperone (PAC2) family protein
MDDMFEIWERPETKELYMIVGWRQWADAGSISSELPQYLIKQTQARKIGEIHSDGFYLFQFPGTHDLIRPTVRFEEGRPISLESPRNEIFYSGDEKRGVLFLSGDEPHVDVERYVAIILHLAESLGVRRIVSFGGVYGELPYDKERFVSCIYSLAQMAEEIKALAVNLSDYKGGASIGSYICHRAGQKDMEFVGFYAFVPTYDFSKISQIGNTIRIENDYMAWLGVMRRVSYMLQMDLDLSDLEEQSEDLIEAMDEKVNELDNLVPQIGVREYMERLSKDFTEVVFEPLGEVWEEELRRLFGSDEP